MERDTQPFCIGGARDSTAGEGGTDPQEPSAPGEDPRLQPASKTRQKIPRQVRILLQNILIAIILPRK